MSVGMSDELTAIQDAIWSKDVLQKICRTAVADGLYEAGLSGGTIEAQDDGGVVDKEYVVGAEGLTREWAQRRSNPRSYLLVSHVIPLAQTTNRCL